MENYNYSDKNYSDKRVVITGGSSGIGLATAKLLIAGGARVLITGRTQATLDAAREELGENAITAQNDVASLGDLDALAERVRSEFGTFDLLFANAGVTRAGPLEDMTEADFDEQIAVNAKGPYFTVQKLAPLLREGGAVVLTTSVANEMSLPMLSAYAASKAALRSVARTLARELLPRGVRVNAVSPGAIDSGVLERTMPADAAEEAKRQYREQNPMGRLGRMEEVAEAVAFLAFGATFTTGAEFTVDGGGSQL